MPKRPAVTRTLNAILYADIVGYSRLMREDEAGTLGAVQSGLARARTIVEGHGGRIANTAGDAFLAVFPSVNGALEAALEFQAGAGAGEANRLVFRIGLNTGDVIQSGGDVYGDGVNVAARVQELADPGGIAVTSSVRAQVSQGLNVGFAELGLRPLKNIAEPVRVFTVTPGSATRRKRAGARRHLSPAVVAMAILVVAIALGGIFLYVSSTIPTPSAEASEAPTIAVLPFRDRSVPPNEDYFVEGVTEDVISLLGRFRDLRVLSWNAVADLDSGNLSAATSDLDTDYVVAGSIQRSVNQLRASVQLSDAVSGRLLWSEKYDQPLTDIFAIQDEISRDVAAALAVRIELLERDRAQTAAPDRFSAYDLVLRGRSYLRKLTRRTNLQARAAFEDALALDDAYAAAHVGLGWTLHADFLFGWSHNLQATVAQAEHHARAAIELDPENASAHTLMAEIQRVGGDLAGATASIDRALKLNPNAPYALAAQGNILLLEGRFAEAIPALETAHRLDPALPNRTASDLAIAYFQAGRYQEAAAVIDDTTVNMGEDPGGHAVQAAALAELGDLDAAKEAAEKVRRIYPFFDAEIYTRNVAPTAAGLLEAMRMAGL